MSAHRPGLLVAPAALRERILQHQEQHDVRCASLLSALGRLEVRSDKAEFAPTASVKPSACVRRPHAQLAAGDIS